MTDKKQLIGAIASFQKDAPIILKSATNPFFKSKYADLPAVWHTIKDLMSANGLAVMNMNVITDGVEYLETRIYHTSGEYISSTSKLSPVKNDPQSVGSAITYMRRYALMSLLGLVADDDDDGNAASGNLPKQNQDKKPPAKQPEKQLTPEEQEARQKAIDECKPIADAIKAAKDIKTLDAIVRLQSEKILSMPDDLKNRIFDIEDTRRTELSTLNAG